MVNTPGDLNGRRSLKTLGVVGVLLFLPWPPAAVAWLAPNLGLEIGLHRAQFWCVLFAFLLVVLCVTWIRKANPEAWNELRDEAQYILWESRHSAWLAGSLGMLAVAVYLVLPFDPVRQSFLERVAASFPIYIAVVGAVIGIHVFHRRSAPITSVVRLLEYLCKDLEDYGEPGQRLLVVYPAPNIGCYRSLLADSSIDEVRELPDDHPYARFRRLLLEAAFKAKLNATLITYPTGCFQALYTVYDEAKAGSDPERAEESARDARAFCEEFRIKTGDPRCHIQMPPPQLPAHVIVIGPVVYLISSYGLPTYRETPDGGPRFAWSERDLAKLLVYRREDESFATLVTHETREHLDSLPSQQGLVLES